VFILRFVFDLLAAFDESLVALDDDTRAAGAQRFSDLTTSA